MKSNHRGFSLVELLVAVVILGIVVVPLLHTFVTSATTAARARKLGDATLAAQNLAERVEAADLSALVANPKNALSVTSAQLYRLEGGSYVLSASPGYRAEQYHIGVTGAASGASSFNAMITLAANASAPANSALITRYSAMDAVFSQAYPGETDDPDTMAKSEFLAVASANSGSYVTSSPARSITMDLTASPPQTVGGKTVRDLTCKLTYRYSFPYSYEQAVTDPVTGVVTGSVTVNDTFTKIIEYDLLPSGFQMVGGEAPSIYLLYNPWYETTGDTIIVNNLKDIPFPFFLVKQVTLSDTELAAKEAHYRAEIRLMQSSACQPTAGAITHSNAKRYLSGQAGDIPSVSYRVYRGPYVYHSGIPFPNDGALITRDAENRFYLVTVALYDVADTSFSGTPIYTFTSAKLE